MSRSWMRCAPSKNRRAVRNEMAGGRCAANQRACSCTSKAMAIRAPARNARSSQGLADRQAIEIACQLTRSATRVQERSASAPASEPGQVQFSVRVFPGFLELALNFLRFRSLPLLVQAPFDAVERTAAGREMFQHFAEGRLGF